MGAGYSLGKQQYQQSNTGKCLSDYNPSTETYLQHHQLLAHGDACGCLHRLQAERQQLLVHL
jgi:hypothetical protein